MSFTQRRKDKTKARKEKPICVFVFLLCAFV